MLEAKSCLRFEVRDGPTGVSTIVIAVIVIVVVAVGALAYYYYGTSTSTSSTTLTSSSTSSSGSITPVQVVLPAGVGSSQSLNFAPSTIKVVIGVNNTIVWSDQDSTPHHVVSVSVPSGASSFDSGVMNNGGTFSVTFSVAGTYQYHCAFHPGWMKGTIVVVQG
jgi:plastocyanin